jgi:hypothetical protein
VVTARVPKFWTYGSVWCMACRVCVTPASSPASHCKQCSALTSPSLHARGRASPSHARHKKHNIFSMGPKLRYQAVHCVPALSMKTAARRSPCRPSRQKYWALTASRLWSLMKTVMHTCKYTVAHDALRAWCTLQRPLRLACRVCQTFSQNKLQGYARTQSIVIACSVYITRRSGGLCMCGRNSKTSSRAHGTGQLHTRGAESEHLRVVRGR